jgi:hypothetical protein
VSIGKKKRGERETEKRGVFPTLFSSRERVGERLRRGKKRRRCTTQKKEKKKEREKEREKKRGK